MKARVVISAAISSRIWNKILIMREKIVKLLGVSRESLVNDLNVMKTKILRRMTSITTHSKKKAIDSKNSRMDSISG